MPKTRFQTHAKIVTAGLRFWYFKFRENVKKLQHFHFDNEFKKQVSLLKYMIQLNSVMKAHLNGADDV